MLSFMVNIRHTGQDTAQGEQMARKVDLAGGQSNPSFQVVWLVTKHLIEDRDY